MEENRQREPLLRGKWLFLVVIWALYGLVLMVSMATGQPESILKILLSESAWGGIGVVTIIIAVFV